MSDLLSRAEMSSLNRALANRTGGRVRVGPKPITVSQGIAVWNSTAVFVGGSVRDTVSSASDLTRMLGTGAALAIAASLAGCATLGGNIKGSFSCRAPDGMCAPTSTIDDAALALIGGEASAQPAGPYSAPSDTARLIQTAAVEPVRSNEKVLRIVFPAHIDEAGRYRETTAIHAVVERGEWMAAGAVQALPVKTSATPPTNPLADQLAMAAPSMRSLGELAAAAPEVQFPDPVAEVDAQNAVEPAPVAGPSAKPVAAMTAKPVTTRTETAVMSAAGTRVAATLGPSSLHYSLPPKPTANPMDAIKAQVAARLGNATPVVRSAQPSPSVAASLSTPSQAKPANRPALFPASEVNR